MWDFAGAQADVLGLHMQSDVATTIAAVAAILPAHLHLFVHSPAQRLALWQNELGGPLTLLRFVSPEESQLFPDHRVSCPLGHRMPGENRLNTLNDHFRLSASEDFDAVASRFESQLVEFFALPDQQSRDTWLDARDRGLVSGTNAQRLDTLYVPGGSSNAAPHTVATTSGTGPGCETQNYQLSEFRRCI